jgi:uncharacterized oxidoreductase
MKLEGNTILITGGSSGIGRGLAEHFHRRGNQVIIAGRRASALNEVADANPGMHAVHLDVSEPESIRKVSAELIAKYPALNVVVNNAGVQFADDVGQPLDEELVTSTIATNLLGPLRLNSALIAHLRRQPVATIINVTSMLGYAPLATTALYSLSKAALRSYTLSLRYQLRDSSVTVVDLSPPYVESNLMERNRTDPRAMPLKDYLDEVMPLLATDTPEVLVERAKIRADAQRPNEVTVTHEFNDIFHSV